MALSAPIIELLKAWRGGERGAPNKLLPLVYSEPRRLAHRNVRSKRPGATLNPSALVVELRLFGEPAQKSPLAREPSASHGG
jgi:hypothetical protein